MFADGYYEYYNKELYSNLKERFPSRPPINMRNLKESIREFDRKKYMTLLSKEGLTPESRGAILFILLMFSRYSYIERLQERAGEHFQVVPNTTKANKLQYKCQEFKREHRGEFSPLYEAVTMANAEMVDALIKCGEDPNIKERNTPYTPFVLAIMNGMDMCVDHMLRYEGGVDVNMQTVSPNSVYNGYTPLMHACENMRIKIALILCDIGADVNKQSANGKTALMIISRTQSSYNYHRILPIVYRLIASGAKLNIKDTMGRTAYTFAKEQANQALMKILEENGGGEVGSGGGRRRTRRHRPKRRL
jgi:ankyrin repeat protein